MKHYNFKINNTTSNNSFCGTDYSKILDNIIAANIIETNPYLFNYNKKENDLIGNLIKDAKKNCTIFDCSYLKGKSDFAKAADFLANYKKKKYTTIPFTIGKTYKLNDGTPICFYDDEIQIGYDIYSYSNFGDIKFLNSLPSNKKNIIINIYNAGNITININ